jgi:pyridoxal phosphate enzyme (YggS family)
MDALAATLRTNVDRVRERIAAAARSCSRDPDSVRLIAVSKYVDAPTTRALVAAGVVDLGESRPQQLWDKAAALEDLDVEWHLVGHLQRNKLRRTLATARWIHSCDSLRLLAAIEQESLAAAREVNVLLEVNISGEPAKTGFSPAQMPAALELAGRLSLVRVRGLMGMAALEGGSAAAERDFAALGQLRDGLRRRAPPGVSLDELSMGMSDDFEIAIRHGATMARIGSALFAGVEGFD